MKAHSTNYYVSGNTEILRLEIDCANYVVQIRRSWAKYGKDMIVREIHLETGDRLQNSREILPSEIRYTFVESVIHSILAMGGATR